MPLTSVHHIYTPPIPFMWGYKFFKFSYIQKEAKGKDGLWHSYPFLNIALRQTNNGYKGKMNLVDFLGQEIQAEGCSQNTLLKVRDRQYEKDMKLAGPYYRNEKITLPKPGFCFFGTLKEAEKAKNSFQDVIMLKLRFRDVMAKGNRGHSYNEATFLIADFMTLPTPLELKEQLKEKQNQLYKEFVETY